MKTRQAKKILKASFTYWRYLVKNDRVKEYRPLPYWSHGISDRQYWDIKAYKERLNPRFREALRVTRKFGRMVYKAAWDGTIYY